MPSNNTIRGIIGATIKIAHLTPWDLTGYVIASQIRDEFGEGDFVAPLTPVVQVNPKTGLPGLILIVIDAALTQTLLPTRAGYYYDIRLDAPNGEVIYIPKINLLLSQRVTRA